MTYHFSLKHAPTANRFFCDEMIVIVSGERERLCCIYTGQLTFITSIFLFAHFIYGLFNCKHIFSNNIIQNDILFNGQKLRIGFSFIVRIKHLHLHHCGYYMHKKFEDYSIVVDFALIDCKAGLIQRDLV